MKRITILIVVVVAATAHADEAPGPLTFERAIDLALGKNPDLALAREAVAGAEAKAAGTKAHRWVTLGVNAAANFWRAPYVLNFGGQPFTLHDQTTTATVVTLGQPLSGLAYLTELVDAAEHQTAATQRDYDRVRLDIAYRTADAYLRVLQMRATAVVAHRSVADIQGALDRAKQLRLADTYTDIDVLRFQSAKAAADQIALRADTSAQSALAGLTVQIGLHDGTSIDVTDDLPAMPPALAMTLDQAEGRARSVRPELGAAREQIAAANSSRRAAREKYLPDIRAVAAWNHFTGVQPFQPLDEEYVGVQASWNVWDWGATHDAVLEAEHLQTKAALTAAALGDQIGLDVRRRWLEAKTTYDSLAAAQTQQQTAEEADRLQHVRFDNAAATTTDVLDSEIEVARARLGFAVARYDYYLALVALARAVGDLPSTQPR